MFFCFLISRWRYRGVKYTLFVRMLDVRQHLARLFPLNRALQQDLTNSKGRFVDASLTRTTWRVDRWLCKEDLCSRHCCMCIICPNHYTHSRHEDFASRFLFRENCARLLQYQAGRSIGVYKQSSTCPAWKMQIKIHVYLQFSAAILFVYFVKLHLSLVIISL